MFEDKLAQDSKNQYNGASNDAPAWRIFMRNYLFGVMHEIDPLFDWAEARQHEPITMEALEEHCAGMMMECDPKVLNHHLWKYLNLNLTGDAKLILQNTPRANGLEAWRKLVIDIVSRSLSRRNELRDGAWIIKPIATLHGIKMAMEHWDKLTKDFVDAGGEPPADDMRQELLIGALPDKL